MAVFYEPEYEVTESVLLRNSRTGAIRELDIRIVRRKEPADRILVECRAHSRKQDVRWIDELQGKAQRLGFPRVVAISSSGFSRPAIREGAERGVETLHLREAEERDWRSWRFGGLRSFGVNFKSHPRVTSLSFGVPAEHQSRVSSLGNLAGALIVDPQNGPIGVDQWCKRYESDPSVIAHFRDKSVNDRINYLKIRVGCAPGVGLVVPPDETVILLKEILIRIEYLRAEYSVPMRPMTIGQDQVLVGDGEMLGQPTRLVVHEAAGKLKVMFEKRVPVPAAQPGKRA